MGGGLGVVYDQEVPPTPQEYMKLLQDKLSGYNLKLIIEPGRSLVANAGILVTQVQYLKKGELHDFAIVDAGMNDMIRPALYQAWMKIDVAERKNIESGVYDVVGPVCESSDFLGKDRSLPIEQGDYIVQFSAGAYGFSMSSTYNSRPMAAEILVNNGKDYMIRKRDTIDDLYRNEILPVQE
jgi:diaminopimelate decarboxylase